MNIPNFISIFRIFSAPVLWILIYFGYETAFKWLLTLAFFTDMIDGIIARQLKQVTKLGSILDSYGDSLIIITGLIGLVIFNPDLFQKYVLVLIVVVSLHIIQLVLSLLKYGRPSSFHTRTAKLGALAVGMFILVTLHFYFIPWLFYVTVVILILDAIEESVLVFLIPEWKTDVKGIYWYLRNKNKINSQ